MDEQPDTTPEPPETWTIMLYITADGTLTNFAVESLKQLNKSINALAVSSVKVAAHFSFPGPAVTPGAAGAGAPADHASPREYIFPHPERKAGLDGAGTGCEGVGGGVSRSLASARVAPLPPTVELSVKKADKLQKLSAQGGAHQATHREVPVRDEAKEPVKEALKAFLKGVYAEDSGLKSDHYALILWGHGPELLLRPPADNSTGDSVSLYLTPEELREVLTVCKPPTGRPLDIIGFDACSMSMFEMAEELKGLADYMVASQDEVPDLSFPYEDLIRLFGGHTDTPSLLADGVKLYVTTYQDCVCNDTTEMNPVTLTALNLNNCGTQKEPGALGVALRSLACELLKARNDKELPDALADVLIEARKCSRDYAGGLYVDLSDFCAKLSGQLGELTKKRANEKTELEKKEELDESEKKKLAALNEPVTWITDIQSACQPVIDALKITTNSLVLVNGSVEISEDGKNAKIQVNGSEISPNGEHPKIRNHGISIYLPYLTVEQFAQVQRPLVKGGTLTGKGGTLTGKGFSEALNGAEIEYMMSIRRELILDTESYYPRLKLHEETNWYAFITEVWTRALMKKIPADLDYHYSAQQSWMNVARGPVNIAKPCP